MEKLGPSSEVEQPCSAEIINEVLLAPNPVRKLEEICSDIPYFLRQEEASLLWQEGKEGKEKLTYRCLPTLNASLRRYADFGINQERLLAEGLVVLCECLEDWSPEQKFKNGKPVDLRGLFSRRMKVHFEELIAREYGLDSQWEFPLVVFYRDCWQAFVEEIQRPPTLAEITTLMEKENKTGLALVVKEGRKEIDKVKLMYQANLPFLSWEEIEGEVAPGSIEEAIEPESLRETIHRIIEGLEPEQAKLIEMRFGLVDGHPMTLEQLGEYYDLTREAVRCREQKALRRLRHPKRSRKLRDFLY